MAKYSVTINTEIEIAGEIYDVEFYRDSETFADDDYGSDADGNRGTFDESVVTDSFDCVMVAGLPLGQYAETFQKDMKQQIENWCEDNFPTGD